MSITAIIPHYWESRAANLPVIVTALLDRPLQPEERAFMRIIIWNNTERALNITCADVINAGRNWGIAARFAAAYLATTDYVFFQDNDLCVQPKTLANLMKYAPAEGESIELQGRCFGSWDAPYSKSSYFINVDKVVDVGLSRFSLMRRSTAMRLAAIIPPNAVDDDLWVSRHTKIHIVPFGEDEGFTNLPETEGLSLNAVPHVQRRDALVRELWADVRQMQSA
jgi:Glycosyl transferase family 2